jgi:hypothetical protein
MAGIPANTHRGLRNPPCRVDFIKGGILIESEFLEIKNE